MKKLFLLCSLLFISALNHAQETSVKGKIIRADNNSAMESVNIVNLNQVIGTSTNANGDDLTHLDTNLPCWGDLCHL